MGNFKRKFRNLGEKFGLVSPVVEAIEKPGSADDIKSWLANKVAAVLKIDASAIEFNTSFAKLGLDSLAAITISGDLEQWLEMEIDATILYQYSTIEELSEYLIQEIARK
jgi:acyl carrier protein